MRAQCYNKHIWYVCSLHYGVYSPALAIAIILEEEVNSWPTSTQNPYSHRSLMKVLRLKQQSSSSLHLESGGINNELTYRTLFEICSPTSIQRASSGRLSQWTLGKQFKCTTHILTLLPPFLGAILDRNFEFESFELEQDCCFMIEFLTIQCFFGAWLI